MLTNKKTALSNISPEYELKKLYKQRKGKAYRGIADGSEDIEISQPSQGVDRLQSPAKGLMEYVTDPSTSAAVEEMGSAVTRMVFLSAMCVSNVNSAKIKRSQPKKVNICLMHIYTN